MTAEQERDLWIKRWNTVRNYLADNQHDGDRSNPEIGTLREIDNLMETLEETYDEPVGGSVANNSEEEEQ